MIKELIQLEQETHDCNYLEEAGPHKLRNIIYQFTDFMNRNHQNAEDAKVSNEVLHYLKKAEEHLDTLKPDHVNINDWKHNIVTFSRAKAAIMYPMHLLKATLRFRKLMA